MIEPQTLEWSSYSGIVVSKKLSFEIDFCDGYKVVQWKGNILIQIKNGNHKIDFECLLCFMKTTLKIWDKFLENVLNYHEEISKKRNPQFFQVVLLCNKIVNQ